MNLVIFTNLNVLPNPTYSFPFSIYHPHTSQQNNLLNQTTWVALLPKLFNAPKPIIWISNLTFLDGSSPCLQPTLAPLIPMILGSPEHSEGLPYQHALFLLVQSCLEWSTHRPVPNWKMPTCLQISPNIIFPTKSFLCFLDWRVKWVTYLCVSIYQVLILSLPNNMPLPCHPTTMFFGKGPFFFSVFQHKTSMV